MAAPNIVNVATITGKTAVLAPTTSPTDIVSNGAGSNTVLKINMLSIANINGTAAATVNVSVFRSSAEWKLAQVISVPAGSTLLVIDKTNSVYLEEGDSLRVTASTNSFLHAVCSYEVIG
jgi:hypothetical protein